MYKSEIRAGYDKLDYSEWTQDEFTDNELADIVRIAQELRSHFMLGDLRLTRVREALWLVDSATKVADAITRRMIEIEYKKIMNEED